MSMPAQGRVAVLLATHNGARFVEEQLRTLTDNRTPFTLCWLDDFSTDDTPHRVRHRCAQLGIPLAEHPPASRCGVPAAFFQLLEQVEAEVYLFCDQDDLWQPGKIDASVASLPHPDRPLLSYSEPLLFHTDTPEVLHSYQHVQGPRPHRAAEVSRAFMHNPAVGNTVALTRGLRELYMRHRLIAREHAAMHDWWMYLLALAADGVQRLHNVPTTHYRQHGANVTGVPLVRTRRTLTHLRQTWHRYQAVRPTFARQAQGFLRAAHTLPQGAALGRMSQVAQRIARIGERQSAASLLRLAREGMLSPRPGTAAWMAAVCLLSHASHGTFPAGGTPPAERPAHR